MYYMIIGKPKRIARRGRFINVLLAALVASETVHSLTVAASIICESIIHQQTRVLDQAYEATLETVMQEIHRDKRGGSTAVR